MLDGLGVTQDYAAALRRHVWTLAVDCPVYLQPTAYRQAADFGLVLG